jgi:hypothetical protein
VARMVDPKMTRFKAMSLDEHTTILEQSAQVYLRAREEMIVIEVVEIPRVTSVQYKSPPEAQDAWERGSLMLEYAQQIINQLQDDPDIINIPRLPTDKLDES